MEWFEGELRFDVFIFVGGIRPWRCHDVNTSCAFALVHVIYFIL
jgi:hypothetical protein